MNDISRLIEPFRRNGGVFDNMTIGYRQDSGYYCASIDSTRPATVFCPTGLMVDIEDIGINEAGFFITRPENYAGHGEFLQEYLAAHFDAGLVEKLLEEKRQIEALSPDERQLLGRINLPHPDATTGDGLEYARQRIFQSHQLIAGPLGKRVIVPFVSLLNHAMNGSRIGFNENGATVSGSFSGEVFAYYNIGDVLMLLWGYGFVTDTVFAYSLPMQVRLPDGTSLRISNNITKFSTTANGFRRPLEEKSGGVINVSWFPMYFREDPWYPAALAASLADEYSFSAEQLLYSMLRFNLNTLLPIAFSLKNSGNSYLQLVATGVERQLALIGGLRA